MGNRQAVGTINVLLKKEAEIAGTTASSRETHGDLRQGFVYERVPHITLKSIANNAEIDVIWEKYEEQLAPLRGQWSVASGQEKTFEEWEIPREADEKWSDEARAAHADFWKLRIERQKQIDASIAANAEYEYLYDKPYQDKNKIRVAGPFTVESLSPHRTLGVDENDELIDPMRPRRKSSPPYARSEVAAASSAADGVVLSLARAGLRLHDP